MNREIGNRETNRQVFYGNHVNKTQPISEDIFPADAYKVISGRKNDDDLVILDVCTPREFANVHIENAINLNFLSRGFKGQLNALDKDKTYFVYCKVGGRSKLAQKQMKKLGFKEVYNVIGGTLLWEEEGLPFASGLESPSRFALCPVFMSIILVKRLRKLLQSGYRSLFTGGETTGRLENKLG